MPTPLFVAASSHSYGSAATGWQGNTAGTLIAVAKLTAVPGAGVLYCLGGKYSATAARDYNFGFDGNTSGTLYLKVGATIMRPSTNMIPTAGEWYVFGARKAGGTVACGFEMLNLHTKVFTTFDSSGTVADRTGANVTLAVGRDNTGNFFGGNIACLGSAWGRQSLGYLGPEESGKLGWNSGSKANLREQLVVGSGYHRLANCWVDLTRGPFGGLRVQDELNPEPPNLLSVGTKPAWDSGNLSTPPGW